MTRAIVADLLAFTAAFLASATVTPAARDLAFKIGLIDQPGPRKVHATPMPMLGGDSSSNANSAASKAIFNSAITISN